MFWFWIPLLILLAVIVWVVFSAARRTRPVKHPEDGRYERHDGIVLKDE